MYLVVALDTEDPFKRVVGYRVEARIETCSRGIGNVIVDGVTAQGRSMASPTAETTISNPSSQLALGPMGAN
jgi:hypothetical protein